MDPLSNIPTKLPVCTHLSALMVKFSFQEIPDKHYVKKPTKSRIHIFQVASQGMKNTLHINNIANVNNYDCVYIAFLKKYSDVLASNMHKYYCNESGNSANNVLF